MSTQYDELDEIMGRTRSNPLLDEFHRLQRQGLAKIEEVNRLRTAADEAEQAWFASTKAPSIGFGVLHDDPRDFEDLRIILQIAMPETTSAEEDKQAIDDLRLRMVDTVKEWLQHIATTGTKTGYLLVED